jgi:hypothetical protein
MYMQHPDEALATYVCNIWNIWNIHLKHMCIAITLCATSQSTFKTSVYNICDIPLKHLKHLKYTLATCAFSVPSTCYLDERRLVDAEWHGGGGCQRAGGCKAPASSCAAIDELLRSSRRQGGQVRPSRWSDSARRLHCPWRASPALGR